AASNYRSDRDQAAPGRYRLIIDNFRDDMRPPHVADPSEGGAPVQKTITKGFWGNITGGRGVPISRRQFVSVAAGAGIASVVAPRVTIAQSSGPIRMGLLAAKTGPLASGGIDMELALTMFLKDRDNTLAGRKVELIVADTAGVPATARTKAQELVEKNN